MSTNVIDGLSEKVEALDMKFGLWFEPEMDCKDTKFYEEHPEWLIETPDLMHNMVEIKYILDFSRDEVVDHIFMLMDNILSKSKISYIKCDMNRYITES